MFVSNLVINQYVFLGRLLLILCLMLVNFDSPAKALGIAVSEQTVYAVDESGSLKLLDISNPDPLVVKQAATYFVSNQIKANLSQSVLSLRGSNASGTFDISPSSPTVSSGSAGSFTTVSATLLAALVILL